MADKGRTIRGRVAPPDAELVRAVFEDHLDSDPRYTLVQWQIEGGA